MTTLQRIASAMVVFISAIIPLGAQNPMVVPSTSTGSQEPRYALSLDVNLVNVTATVIDDTGRYVENLTAEDFRVYEDGKEQPLAFFSHDARVPISLGMLIDSSGSLQDKLRQGLQTAREIAATLSSGDEMFVITFDSHVSIKQKFTNNPEEIERSLGDMRAHGETAVYDAISAGLHEMQSAKYEKRILLLVTDGFDTRSKINSDQAEALLRSSGVFLYAIGIDDDDNNPATRRRTRYHIYEYMLGKLTSAAGGRVIRLYTGRNYDLNSFSQLLLGELHQRYTLGYYPAVRPGESVESKNIEVQVTRPGTRILIEKLHAPGRNE